MSDANPVERQFLVIETVRAVRSAEWRRQFVTRWGTRRPGVSDPRCGSVCRLHFSFHPKSLRWHSPTDCWVLVPQTAAEPQTAPEPKIK